LLAGEGLLPLEFVRSVKIKGEEVVVFALKGMALPEIEKEADKVYWLEFGQFARLVFFLLKDRVKKLTFLGKIKKEVIYNKGIYDAGSKTVLKKMKNKKDYSILRDVTEYLRKIGVEVIDPSPYLVHLFPSAGFIGTVRPDAELESNIAFGYETAKKVAGMDIGQTVIVKDSAVVAVEAMEGTDATIARGKDIAGEGCTMVKVSRPDQDMRWDIPTVGPATMQKLIENKYKALVIESGKLFVLDKETFSTMADQAGIVVKVV